MNSKYLYYYLCKTQGPTISESGQSDHGNVYVIHSNGTVHTGIKYIK